MWRWSTLRLFMESSDEPGCFLISLTDLPPGALRQQKSKKTVNTCWICGWRFGLLLGVAFARRQRSFSRQLCQNALGDLHVSVRHFCISLYLLYHLTIFLQSTVLLTLGLPVELVAVGLADALFVGHTQTHGGIKGPDGWLSCAWLGHHGQTAHSCGVRSKECFSSIKSSGAPKFLPRRAKDET